MLLFFIQVFQVRKVTGANTGKIFAMKVLKKVISLSPSTIFLIAIKSIFWSKLLS